MQNALGRDKVSRHSEAQQCNVLRDGAPGVVDSLRGISDYSDIPKSGWWQNYSAGTAAAFARALLRTMQPVATIDTPDNGRLGSMNLPTQG